MVAIMEGEAKLCPAYCNDDKELVGGLLRLDDLWMDGRLAVSTSTRTSLSTEVDVTNYDDTTIQYTDNPPTFYEHYLQILRQEEHTADQCNWSEPEHILLTRTFSFCQ